MSAEKFCPDFGKVPRRSGGDRPKRSSISFRCTGRCCSDTSRGFAWPNTADAPQDGTRDLANLRCRSAHALFKRAAWRRPYDFLLGTECRQSLATLSCGAERGNSAVDAQAQPSKNSNRSQAEINQSERDVRFWVKSRHSLPRRRSSSALWSLLRADGASGTSHRRVQCHGGANERLQRLFINLVALMEIDGTPGVAFETGVEEA